MSIPQLSWESLGDISAGRPNLGPTMRVEFYRLALFSIRAELGETLGVERAKKVTYLAGQKAGRVFAHRCVEVGDDIATSTKRLQSALLEMGVGVMLFEKTDIDGGRLELTLSEDLDCSGVEECGETFCIFDEGFISGALEVFTGKRFDVTEIDCWATGSRTCRFTAVAVDN